MSQLATRSIDLLLPDETAGEIKEVRERRYLVDEATADTIADALSGTEADPAAYDVTTTYLSQRGIPYRLRQYDGGSDFKLESKQRTAGRSLKASFELDSPIAKTGYEGSVTYHRSAYEADGVRVTIDRNLRSVSASLGKTVVEVKGATVPDAIKRLLPAESLTFGKHSWATSG